MEKLIEFLETEIKAGQELEDEYERRGNTEEVIYTNIRNNTYRDLLKRIENGEFI